MTPVWGRDGSSITVFEVGDADDPRGRQAAIVRQVVASGESETLYTRRWNDTHTVYPVGWTPDDHRLIYITSIGDGPLATFELVAGGDAAGPDSLLFEDGMRDAALSHDGEWLSYMSDQAGVNAVYVRRFPAGEQIRVSLAGGREPVWAPDDNELFYIAGNQLVRAVRAADGEFGAGDHEVLFDMTDYPAFGPSGARYDVHPDGNRFLMVRPNSVDNRPKINVVTNWFEVLARLATEQR